MPNQRVKSDSKSRARRDGNPLRNVQAVKWTKPFGSRAALGSALAFSTFVTSCVSYIRYEDVLRDPSLWSYWSFYCGSEATSSAVLPDLLRMFSQLRIKKLTLNYLYVAKSPSSMTNWDYEDAIALAKGEDIFRSHLAPMIAKKLNDKGYQVTLGETIKIEHGMNHITVSASGSPRTFAFSYNQKFLLPSALEDYFISEPFFNAYRNDGFDAVLAVSLRAHYATNDKSQWEREETAEIERLSPRFYVFDFKSRQLAFANCKGMGGVRNSHTLSQATYREGLKSTTATKYVFTESAEDFYSRFVVEMLRMFPLAPGEK